MATSDLATQAQEANVIKWESSHGEMSITLEDARLYFCPTANDRELMMFLKLCQYQKLNPFLREAYLVKYGTGADAQASIIVGKEVFTKRAQTIEDCLGFEAGIVVSRKVDGEDELVHIEGAMKLPGDKLLGGYSKVRSASRGESYHAVALEEYIGEKANGEPTKFWSKMPSTMIRKVALVQGLRESYPSDFQGMYDSTEMDAVPESRIIDVKRNDGQPVGDAWDPPGGFAHVDGPDLGRCPIHDVVWNVKADNFKKNVWRGGHKTDGPWCLLAKVYEDLTKKAFTVRTGVEFNQKQFNAWLKSRVGGTWSTLSAEKQIEAYNRCRATDEGEVIDPANTGATDANHDAQKEPLSEADQKEANRAWDDKVAVEQDQARAKVTDPEVAAMFERGTNGPAAQDAGTDANAAAGDSEVADDEVAADEDPNPDDIPF